MCLIVLAYQIHPEFPLVLINNRDEFYERNSTPMHWWERPKGVLAGRDERAQGTWFGVNPAGKWAVVTNYREPGSAVRQVNSRGELVVNFLRDDASAADHVHSLKSKAEQYNGFNLLLGDGDQIYCFSNRQESVGPTVGPLKPGVYGLSNHLIDTPWPKVIRAKKRLSEQLTRADVESQPLLDLMYDASLPADDQLPDTGVGLEKERMLSPMFIASRAFQYGTRCTTALKVSRDGRFYVAERSYPDRSTVEFSFDAR